MHGVRSYDIVISSGGTTAQKDKTKEKDMKFHSAHDTTITIQQGILVLVNTQGWQLQVDVTSGDFDRLAMFYQHVEELGGEDVKVDDIAGMALHYVSDTDEIHITDNELEDERIVWVISPEDLYKITTCRS